MANDEIVGIALILVGGFLVYKFVLPKLQSGDSSSSTTTPASASPIPTPSNQQQQQQQQIINNNYYYDFIQKYGTTVPISPNNRIMLINFDKRRYARDKNYRRYIHDLLDQMTPGERDYWNDILEKIKLKEGGGCVQNMMCMMGYHFDNKKCKCVKNNAPPEDDDSNGVTINLSAFSRVRI